MQRCAKVMSSTPARSWRVAAGRRGACLQLLLVLLLLLQVDLDLGGRQRHLLHKVQVGVANLQGGGGGPKAGTREAQHRHSVHGGLRCWVQGTRLTAEEAAKGRSTTGPRVPGAQGAGQAQGRPTSLRARYRKGFS